MPIGEGSHYCTMWLSIRAFVLIAVVKTLADIVKFLKTRGTARHAVLGPKANLLVNIFPHSSPVRPNAGHFRVLSAL